MGIKLFIPCFIDQGAPKLAEAVVDLLARLKVAWEYPEKQTCCGQFALTVGDPATARRLLGHFLKVFGGADAILCPSASCTHMVRFHYPRLAQDLKERQEIEAVTARVWELGEWLANMGRLPFTPRFAGSLALHRSCKARQLGVLPAAAQLLGQVQGLRVLNISPYYSCCGFGGTFSLQHPELSQTMGEAYLEAVRDTGATGLVSLDYSCLQHLSGIAAARGWELQFFHLAEILAGPTEGEGHG